MHVQRSQQGNLGSLPTPPAGAWIRIVALASTTAGTVVGARTFTTTAGMVLPHNCDGWLDSAPGTTISGTATGTCNYIVLGLQ